jgi:F0F1-type ATP synthase assembly protein I
MRTDEEKSPVTLETLTKRLEDLKRSQPESGGQAKPPGDAARAAIDFASATAVGCVLGYGFDAWQETSPWGLLVGLLLGTAAGIKLMFHEIARASRAATRR